MKNIRDRRKKLLDLTEAYCAEDQKQKIENLASKLGITPESFVDIHEGRQGIDPELAQRVKELYDNTFKNENKEEEEEKAPLIRNLRGKKIDPELGKRIDKLWDDKFKNKDEEFIIGKEIQNKIDNYEKLKFFEKKLVPRDFNYSLYGLQHISNIPEFGEQIIIIDCNDGTEYPTNIQKNQHSISTGLKFIWDKFNRRNSLKQGDTIGIAIDPENNHRIYVDFEYKERDKLYNQKNEYHQEDIRSTEHDTVKDTEISLEKKLDKKELENSQKKIRNIEYDPEKEIEISLEKRRYASRNINSPVRDTSFRERILNVYNDRCAICGLQMNMVEACHIIPVEDNGTDEIINGIALCHNHHKAFDSGLILINEEYSIILNHSKIKDIKSANIAGGLDDFIKNSRIGEKIFLPDNHKFYPGPDFLIKKRDIIFVNIDKE